MIIKKICFIFLIFLSIIFANAEDRASTTAEVPEFSAYKELLDSRYSLFTHKRTYLLPFSYVFNPSRDLYSAARNFDGKNTNEFYEKTEAEFQISFFLPIYRKVAASEWDFMFAYTHHSWWQVYNSAWSKPFRETNYAPELFFRRITANRNDEFLGFKVLGYDLGYIHESNGQVQLLSRSWDRFFARTHLLSNGIGMILTVWARLPEEAGQDDNSSILTYMGVGSIEVQKTIGRHSFEVEIPIAAQPGVDLKYSYPWKDGFRWFVDIRYGYGQSLVEYDRETKRFALGIMLENFLDKRD